MKLVRDEDGNYSTKPLSAPGEDILQVVFENGEIVRNESFENIRLRANAGL